jgi:Fe-S cluster biogenesis protein NfuA
LNLQNKIANMRKEIEGRIQKALDQIRPYLQSDGGDISFISLDENNEVKIKLLGACENCPMSIQTLKLGIESAIKKAVPEITRVIAVDENLESVI